MTKGGDMNDDIERFRKRKARYAEANLEYRDRSDSSQAGHLRIDLAAGISLTPVVPHYEDSEDIPDNPDALLTELRSQIDAQKIGNLLDTIQQESLQIIIRQFGLGRVLFSDMMGGNVTTVHNVRNDDYANAPNTAYAKTGEAAKYDDRGEYNSKDYHGDKQYIAKNRSTQGQFENGTLEDAYGDGVLSRSGTQKNLDHVKSAKEIHDDRARVLAEINGADLANQDSNLKATSETINKSKKQKSAKEFLEWVETTKLPDLERRIQKIENKGDITDADRLELNKLKSSKEQFESIDKNKVLEADKIARQNIDRDINRKYYQSEKFVGQVAKTSLEEGGKMGLQQALGVLMEEFVRAVFDEVKDAWRNGFKDKIDDTFFSALRTRLFRVSERVQGKWRDAVQAFKDGAISGMFSNIITVLINMFATTAANIVRMVREGIMVLYRALKILFFPPKEQSWAETADAAVKLLAAGAITVGGIALEEYLGTQLTPFLGSLADYVIPIVVGLATGVTTACTVYMLDKIDLFGVQAKIRHQQVMARLTEMIEISEGNIQNSVARIDASIEEVNYGMAVLNYLIDGPVLLHIKPSSSFQGKDKPQDQIDYLPQRLLPGPEKP